MNKFTWVTRAVLATSFAVGPLSLQSSEAAVGAQQTSPHSVRVSFFGADAKQFYDALQAPEAPVYDGLRKKWQSLPHGLQVICSKQGLSLNNPDFYCTLDAETGDSPLYNDRSGVTLIWEGELATSLQILIKLPQDASVTQPWRLGEFSWYCPRSSACRIDLPEADY